MKEILEQYPPEIRGYEAVIAFFNHFIKDYSHKILIASYLLFYILICGVLRASTTLLKSKVN